MERIEVFIVELDLCRSLTVILEVMQFISALFRSRREQSFIFIKFGRMRHSYSVVQPLPKAFPFHPKNRHDMLRNKAKHAFEHVGECIISEPRVRTSHSSCSSAC
jgi:hypothetical protein